MVITIVAKCDDRCNIETDGGLHHGYVPSGLGIGGGDYIRFKLDTDTGKIVGYPELDDEDVEALFDE